MLILHSTFLLLACSGEEPATLTEVQAEIFDNSCAFSTCHGDGGGAQGLSLTDGSSYAELVGVAAEQVLDLNLVEPGDHENSYLWKKCAPTDDVVAAAMPEGADGLDPEQLARLESWIDNGALDD